MLRIAPWIAFALLAACGPRTTATTEAPVGPPDLGALNAAARRGAVVETLFGQEVGDPFRTLESDTPETWAWIDAQSAATERYMEAHADAATAERLEHFLSIGFIQGPAQAGARTFYLKRDGAVEQGSLYVLETGSDTPRVLVDPNLLGERVSLDWFFPSNSGELVAYGLSEAGDERSVLHVLDVDAGTDLAERIPHAKWTSLSWLEDDTGFYYTHYPREGDPDYSAEEEDNYFPHLFFHALGTAPDGGADPLVYRLEQKTDFIGPAVSPDDKWVVLNVFHGWSQSDVLLLDRVTPGAAPVPVDVGGEHLVAGEVHGDQLYLSSNEDHPRFRIVAAPLATPADRTTWREIVPEGEGTIESWSFAADRLAVRTTENVASRVRLYGADGTAQGEIELPLRGSVAGPAGQRDAERVVLEFDSFFLPPALYEFDPATTTLRKLDQVAADIDPAAFELEQVTVPSRDGTPINVYVAHAKDLPHDGARPVLASAYGGFNIPLLPGFIRNVLYWYERGGVYVQANLRGGSEFGEDWHRAGMMSNKENVFDDFEAVVRWLPTTGLTSPEHIALNGASNGGLLMGASIVRFPDAFRAATSEVGLYDMVRFSQFPPAEIWMTEYGDPSQPDAFAWLYDYSPYHAVRDGTAYPSVLITTADLDTRVSWRHSTKFAARLQEATSSGNPILFYMERAQGHGVSTGRSDMVRQYTRLYTFLETELGMR